MVITTRITPTPTGIPTTLMTGALAYTWDTPGGQVQCPGGGVLFIPPITMATILIGTTIITTVTIGMQVNTTIAPGQVIITDIGMGTMMDITMGIME